MSLQRSLEMLNGKNSSAAPDSFARGELLLKSTGIGYSQMNELLLMVGYDRISDAFFQYLVDGTPIYQSGSALSSLEQIDEGVRRFRQHALIRFGNFTHAFKHLSQLSGDDLAKVLALFTPVEDSAFAARHDPVKPIETISGDETYYLGYLIRADLDRRIARDPGDINALQELKKCRAMVSKGIRNHESYLVSDHMDVYVATSMRERQEYAFVSSMTSKIFSSPQLAKLKLRWFDPTQAYCHDRIDKGLSEALMLKRATCTLYFVQESDTLGKDSELASTLAQGKPVIAYIPLLTNANQIAYTAELLKVAHRLYPELDEGQLIIRQLQVFDPNAAWKDATVKKWLQEPSQMELGAGRELLMESIRRHYDGRAKTLKESHPLGIQVHLETGVANGVLVARTPEECAELIYRIVTNRLEFKTEESEVNGRLYVLLRERISGSIFRVVSGDQFLTNAFWNFYLAD